MIWRASSPQGCVGDGGGESVGGEYSLDVQVFEEEPVLGLDQRA